MDDVTIHGAGAELQGEAAEYADGCVWMARERAKAGLLPSLLFIATLLPQGLNVRPGGLLLTMPRLVLLLALPVLTFYLITGRLKGFRFALCDAVVLLAGLWMFLAVSMTQGVGRAVVGAGIMIVEFCGGYFTIRATLSRPGEAAAAARMLACLIAVDGVLSVLDVIFQRPVLLDLANALTGYDQAWQEDYRHGFMRALGMQEHPIQLGNVCAFGAVLAVTLMSSVRRVAVLAGCLIGLAASNSSAPILGLAVAFAFLAYHKATEPIAARWTILLTFSGASLAAFLAIHPSPFSFLIMHTAAVPQDGFYRLLIWNVVGPLVLAKPLFGLGLESGFAAQFHVNNTIDCFWLASASNFGIIGSGLFALTLLTACSRAIPAADGTTPDDVRLGRALGLIIFLYFLIGMTVHFWGTVWTLLGMFAAMRVNLGSLAAYGGSPTATD